MTADPMKTNCFPQTLNFNEDFMPTEQQQQQKKIKYQGTFKTL